MILTEKSDDIELIKHTITGDKNAYNLLIKKHQQAVRSFIASRCKYSSDVDDLAQEAFIVAYHKLASLQQRDIFRSWLCGIALNLVRNHHRKFNPTVEGKEDELDQLISEQLETQVTENDHSFSLSALRTCLQELNPKGQQLITLHYLNNLSVKDLSKKLELKHSTLTMRLHRIRALLKQCIGDKLARDNS